MTALCKFRRSERSTNKGRLRPWNIKNIKKEKTAMFKKSLFNIMIRGAMIGSTLAVVGASTVPMSASARSVTREEVRQIKHDLVNVFNRQQLVSALEEAKAAGAPWQYLLESTALYTLKTGDYSMLDAIEPHLSDYVDSFSPDTSLLFDSADKAAVFFRILQASIDLHNGDEQGAADELNKAKEIDEVTFKEILSYSLTIQNYLKS